MIAHSEPNPGCSLGWPELKQLMPGVFVALQVSHLYLQQREIPQYLDVVFVPLQSVPVRLDGLTVLRVGQDLLGELEAVLVLLLLVTFQDPLEQSVLLRRERIVARHLLPFTLRL